MQITQEKIDAQNALLKIKIEPEDYSSRYDAALKNYRRQVAMPGFRAGKVPMGMIKSKYGRSLLADELNKMLNSSLQNYISEKDLHILGSPIPSEEHRETGDWDNPSDFEFVYELGLAPDINVQIDKKQKFDFYTVKIDNVILDKQIKDIARRYGKLSEAEVSTAADMLVGDFVELDENDEVKPAGIMHKSTVSVEFLGADIQGKFENLKVGDAIVVDPHKVSRGHDDMAKLLNISHEQVHSIHTNFKFIVREIKRLQPAELNQEFFDKIFGEGEVETEAAFREKISEDMSKGFLRDSDQLFKRDITNVLVEKHDPSLPDSFLKKWIVMSNDKPVTPEEVERDYHNYRVGLQWQLIFNNLIGQKAIEVSQDEVVEKTKGFLASQYAQYDIPAPEDEQLTKSAMEVLSKQDEARKIYDMLYDEKLVAYIRENATVSEKEVSYDDFVEMASKG